MRSRKVSAAEKYAEYEAMGYPRPLCDCHAEPMKWRLKADVLAGGYWGCAVLGREWHRKTRESRAAVGLCNACGKRPHEPGWKRCRPCAEKYPPPWADHDFGPYILAARINAAALGLDPDVCYLCGKQLSGGGHGDHFLPRCRFPELADDPGNVFPCCADCNMDKFDKPVGPWLTSRGPLDPNLGVFVVVAKYGYRAPQEVAGLTELAEALALVNSGE